MQTYLVGGAVRDRLLGLPVADRDWVVVGATPQQLLDAGYLPVGRDFPVFLHPQTREEVALARTERKTAPGYHGFAFHAAPEVTLEQDLSRRDLTINAMAEDAAGHLIDPFGGARDLLEKRLRHVSPAFAEDPVRILRLARFAARFAEFEIAPETMALARQMVDSGDVDALVAERVWQELARGLTQARPSRMLEVLRDCGALARLLPEVDAGARRLRTVDLAARRGAGLAVRLACLVHDLPPDALHALAQRLRVPTDCRALAEVVAREERAITRSGALGAAALVVLLERCDALRKPQRLGDILLACECIAGARAEPAGAPFPQRARLLAAQAAALVVPTAEVAAAAAARGQAGLQIGDAVRDARVGAVAAALSVSP